MTAEQEASWSVREWYLCSGVCHYRNGDYYEGGWHAGLRHGMGMQQCTDGSNYVSPIFSTPSPIGPQPSRIMPRPCALPLCPSHVHIDEIHLCNSHTASPLARGGRECKQYSQELDRNGRASGARSQDPQKPPSPEGAVAREQVGGYVGGQRQGCGIYSFPNGDRYEGECAADAPSGHGVYRFAASGAVLEGSWAAGAKHGFAVLTVGSQQSHGAPPPGSLPRTSLSRPSQACPIGPSQRPCPLHGQPTHPLSEPEAIPMKGHHFVDGSRS